LSRVLAEEEHALYARFQETLREEDRVAFRQQIAVATIEQHEPSFTYFGGTAAAPTFDTSVYRNNLIRAYYDDVDGQTVHVILHLMHGYISWIERFRIDTSRLTHGRSKAQVEMVIPPAGDLRFVRDRYAMPRVGLGDGLPRLLTSQEREVYGRFCDALRSEDVAAFAAQVAIATITKHDSSHTSFGNIDTAPAFDAGWYEYLVDAFYDDVDNVTVNVIFHFTDGGISWMERFRLDMQPVQIAVPEPQDLRFVMIKM
jgi:hypothetical protein